MKRLYGLYKTEIIFRYSHFQKSLTRHEQDFTLRSSAYVEWSCAVLKTTAPSSIFDHKRLTRFLISLCFCKMTSQKLDTLTLMLQYNSLEKLSNKMPVITSHYSLSHLLWMFYDKVLFRSFISAKQNIFGAVLLCHLAILSHLINSNSHREPRQVWINLILKIRRVKDSNHIQTVANIRILFNFENGILVHNYGLIWVFPSPKLFGNFLLHSYAIYSANIQNDWSTSKFRWGYVTHMC